MSKPTEEIVVLGNMLTATAPEDVARLTSIIQRLIELHPLPSGVAWIASERERQITAEGWTPEHDDEHAKGEISMAALAYVGQAVAIQRGVDPDMAGSPTHWWPWQPEWWKPSDQPTKNLVKAGALIAAEIDRIERGKRITLPLKPERSDTP